MWFISFIRCKIIHLADKTDLFKICNLLWGGKEWQRDSITAQRGQRQRQPVEVGYSELAGSALVVSKVIVRGTFWNCQNCIL